MKNKSIRLSFKPKIYEYQAHADYDKCTELSLFIANGTKKDAELLLTRINRALEFDIPENRKACFQHLRCQLYSKQQRKKKQ